MLPACTQQQQQKMKRPLLPSVDAFCTFSFRNDIICNATFVVCRIASKEIAMSKSATVFCSGAAIAEQIEFGWHEIWLNSTYSFMCLRLCECEWIHQQNIEGFCAFHEL